MPFESEKQRKFMWAKHPKIAKKWSEEEKKKGKKYEDGGVVMDEDKFSAISDAFKGSTMSSSDEKTDKNYQGKFDKKKARREALRRIIKSQGR